MKTQPPAILRGLMPRKPRRRHHLDPLVLSSWAMVLPAFLWALSGHVVESLVAAMAAFSSVNHHRNLEPEGLGADADRALSAGALVLGGERYYVAAMRLDIWAVVVVALASVVVQAYAYSQAVQFSSNMSARHDIHLSWHLLILITQSAFALAVLLSA